MYKQHKQYRLPGFDYSQNGIYFITVVTKERQQYFGNIKDQEMNLSPIGKYAADNFKAIAEKLSSIAVTEYTILPDHIHLIISIENSEIKEDKTAEGLRPLVKGSISSFINHLKGNVQRWCNKNGYSYFAWQARFHDRIVRDADEHERISMYLQNNVINWNPL